MDVVARPVCKKKKKKKKMRILFSENVVIVQSSSKCPGLSVRSGSLNKACRVAVVFAHKGMICGLPVGSNKQRLA